jgi:hypothetical protein
VLWLSEQEPGAEYVALWQRSQGYRVHSDWLGADESGPVRAMYRLDLDRTWVVRELAVRWSTSTTTERLRVQRDASGAWRVNGELRPDLERCIDVDVAWSPLTNTLPIRRTSLGLGERCDLSVAYIAPPKLEVAPDGQRYTRLGLGEWRYESLESDFSAEITVDEDGLVIDYPPLFRRVAQWSCRS